MSAGPRTVCVVYPTSGSFDAIAQRATGVVAELRRRGIDAAYVSGGAAALLRHVLRRDEDWLLVEYMPFSYGRWGFAPALPAAAGLARLIPGAPRIAVVVHEAAVAPEDLRSGLMSLWQRVQLRALLGAASVLFAPTDAKLRLLEKMSGGRPVTYLPSPSNIPRDTADREAARAELGIAAGTLVAAVLGGSHPSRALEHVEAALDAIATAAAPCTLLNLGADAPALALPESVRVLAPGPSSGDALSSYLAAADLYLAPFHDGTSTARTTVAAALAHGLPIVGTDGPQTDDLLRSSGACVLAPLEPLDEFAHAALTLARDAAERERLGSAALRLYDDQLSWEVAGNRILTSLASGP
jgi:glycosyltransferase involved in cell wall biosynthesis